MYSNAAGEVLGVVWGVEGRGCGTVMGVDR